MSDAELLLALARNLRCFRDDPAKALLLMHLFGRRWPAALDRLRELAPIAGDDLVGQVNVVTLQLVRIDE